MPESRESVKTIFGKALEIHSEEERARYLDQACAADESLRAEIEDLLGAIGRAGAFLVGPSPGFPTIDQPITEKPGAQIGPYKLLQQIGEGGMGVVYMAEQTEPVERRVALKIIKPGMDTRQVIARFEAERQALAMMDHPNIAKVLDAGATEAGRPYFVMELVNGLPVTKYSDEQHLTPKERLDLFVPICKAVQHAHQKGIIHRDLKPSNILVALYDGKPVPKIIDFGVAKATSQTLTEKTMFTQLGQVVGTLEYMSPEQAGRNQLDIDTRSDIYSLGVVLYELLIGDTPFDRQRLRSAAFDEMLRIIREEEPPRPSTKLSSSHSLPSVAASRGIEPAKLNTLIRGEIDWIVMKAMEKDRNRRYETVSAFAADVQHYLNDEAVVACPPSTAYRFRKFARRNKVTLFVSGMLAATLLVIVGSVGWTVRDRAAREAEIVREREQRQAEVARERDQRRARTRTEVEVILADVDRLAQEQHWDEALATAKRAEAAVTAGEAEEAVREKVRTAIRELLFVVRLNEIRMEMADIRVRERSFDYTGAAQSYGKAFRDFGVDVESLPAPSAITQLAQHPRILTPIVTALDSFTVDTRRSKAGRVEGVDWRQLVEIARGLDRDLLRNQLRSMLGRDVTEGLQASLRQLQASFDVRIQGPQTSDLLAEVLGQAKLHDLKEEVLREAQQEFPGDFWLNFNLGNVLHEREAETEAVRYFSAALGSSPDNEAALNDLGVSLYHLGKLDEASACYRRAIELEPNYEQPHNNLGVVLDHQGKLDEAIACHRKALEIDPTYTKAHYNLGNALFKQGKLDEAADCFRQAFELNPKFTEAYDNLGTTLNAQGKLDEAIACHRKALEIDPTHTTAYYNLGHALYKQGKLDEAIVCYRRALELDPKLADAYVNLGNALGDLGHRNEAIDCYRKAIACDPNLAMAYNNLGNHLEVAEEAIANFRKALELDPQLSLAHYNLGVTLTTLGQFEDAVECFRKAIEIDPRFAAAHQALGLAFEKQGQLVEALSSYQQSVELEPNNAVYRCFFGKILSLQGRRDEAVACFRKAIQLSPGLDLPHIYLGDEMRGRRKLDEAIAEYHKALELDPKSDRAMLNLGVAFVAAGKLDEAISCFRQVLQLVAKDDGRPARAMARYNLGIALFKQGKLDEAADCFRQAFELNPKLTEACDNLGVVLDHQGKLDEAIACHRKAIEVGPTHTTAYYNLGHTLHKQGKLDEAIVCYRRALELDPDYAPVLENLGAALVGQGKVNEAIACYGKAIELDPKSASAHNNLGDALARQGKLGEAVACFQTAVELAPKVAAFRQNLAKTQANWSWRLATAADPSEHEPGKAVELAKLATEAQPESPNNWNNLGIAQYRAGNWQAAVDALGKADSMQKHGDRAHRMFFAMAYWQLGDKEKARDLYAEGADWIAEFGKDHSEQNRFRAEAEELMGITKENRNRLIAKYRAQATSQNASSDAGYRIEEKKSSQIDSDELNKDGR